MGRLVALSVLLFLLGCFDAALAPGQSTTNREEAEAFAKAIYLRASDLPGSKEFPPESGQGVGGESKEAPTLGELFRCAGPPSAAHRPLAEHESTLILGRRTLVFALARVMEDEAITKAQIDPLNSRRGHRCLARFVKVTATGKPERLSKARYPVKAVFVSVSRFLGAGATEIRTLSKPPHSSSSDFVHLSFVFFRIGPAEVIFEAGGGKALAAGTERRLLVLLHERATAYMSTVLAVMGRRVRVGCGW
jgi:hypothetical protein